MRLALFGDRELIKRHSTQGGFGRLCGTCCGMATLQENVEIYDMQAGKNSEHLKVDNLLKYVLLNLTTAIKGMQNLVFSYGFENRKDCHLQKY